MLRTLAAAVVAMMVAACGGSTSGNNGPSKTGGTLNYRLNGNWDTLDPAVTASDGGGLVAGLAYDRLIDLDAKRNPIPWLAKSWTVTPKVVTFTLRTDATCADKTPVTASVVAGSLRHMLDPKTNGPQVPRYFGPGPFTVTGDDSTHVVTVASQQAFSDMIYGFATNQSAIICPAGLADLKSLQVSKSFGSGAFILQALSPGDSITLIRRRDWKWGPHGSTSADPGLPATVIGKVVTSETTAANLLLTGGLDVSRVQGPDVLRLKDEKSLDAHLTHNLGPWEFIANEDSTRAGTDPTVRQALFMTINQKDFVQAAFGGLGEITPSIFQPGVECFDPNAAKLLPKYDVKAAQQLLVNDGYTLGSDGKLSKNGLPFKLNILGSSIQGNGPDYVLAQLTSLGVTATVQKLDMTTWYTQLRTGKYDVAIVHAAPSTAATTVATIYGKFPPNGTNFEKEADPAIDNEVPLAFGSVGSERCQHWIAVQEAYLKGYHVMPLAAPDNYAFTRGVIAGTIQGFGIDVTTLTWK